MMSAVRHEIERRVQVELALGGDPARGQLERLDVVVLVGSVVGAADRRPGGNRLAVLPVAFHHAEGQAQRERGVGIDRPCRRRRTGPGRSWRRPAAAARRPALRTLAHLAGRRIDQRGPARSSDRWRPRPPSSRLRPAACAARRLAAWCRGPVRRRAPAAICRPAFGRPTGRRRPAFSMHMPSESAS